MNNHQRFGIWHLFLAILGTTIIGMGCEHPEGGVISLEESAALEQVGTVEIEETDKRFIGTLADADVERDPFQIYVADRKMRRVAVITDEGSIERFIGEAGQGPGELGRPVFLSVDGSRIVVAQQRWRGFTVYDTSGTYIDNHLLSDGHWVGGYDLFHYADGYILPISSFNPIKEGTLQRGSQPKNSRKTQFGV